MRRLVLGSTVILTAFFFARGVTVIACGVLEPTEAPSDWSAPIAERRIDAEAIATSALFAQAPPTDPPATECDTGLRLVAAMVDERDPSSSLATMRVGDTRRVVRPGAVLGHDEILGVHPTSVTLRHGALVCRVAMFEPRADPTPQPSAIRDGTGADRTHFVVSEAFRTQLLADRTAIASLARVVVRERGPALYGIRRGSPLAEIGLMNGDVLRSINGYSLTDPAVALEAYLRLRDAPALSLSIERRGQPLNLEYEVR